MSEVIQSNNKALDVVKLIASLGLLFGGIAAFYILGDQPVYVRVPVLLVLVAIAVAVFLTTANGKTIWGFIQGSRVEVRKMVWPTRKETLQTTLTIFIVVFLLGIFLWLVDLAIGSLFRMLTGLGG